MANSDKKSKKERKKSTQKASKGLSQKNKDNLRLSSGLFLIFISVVLIISFVSHFFTGRIDQSILNAPASELEVGEVRNWMGKLGAVLSQKFISDWFGLGAFLLIPATFFYGLQLLFRKPFISWKRFSRYGLFTLFWLPPALTYFFYQPELLLLGGGIGFSVNEYLMKILGSAGTGLLTAFTLIVFLALSFRISIQNLVEYFNKIKPDVGDLKMPFTVNLEDEEEPQSFEQEIQNEQQIEHLEPDLPTLESHIELAVEPTEQNGETNVSQKKEPDEDIEIEAVVGDEEVLSNKEVDKKKKEFEPYDPTLDLSRFQKPSIDLLRDYGSSTIQVDRDELEANKDRIVSTLKNYNIDIANIKATIGPTVTLYEIIPAAGVRISKIKNLEDDIALSLSALGIRIIAPIPGKGTIGIEVPNRKPETVSMRSMIASDKFQNSKMSLPVALGKTISNESYIADLAKMPHLLIAGATGQGKSVGINAILVSLLYHLHPSQLKFVLVDPKKVELTLYNKIERHYLAKLPDSEEPIITDTTKVINTLNSLCIEMDQRYDLLKDAMVRNIREYNDKFIGRKLNPELGHRYMPYIVLVIDEFADLIMTAGKEIETPIARLAQLARAIGIHLIVATQRPSVNVITGIIKANFPARSAFRVTSKIDSRTILDTGGADQLIGRGDMLVSLGSDILRLQCPFVDTPEVEQITDFIGNQQGYPDAYLLPEYVGESSSSGGSMEDMERDALFEEAAKIVVQHQQGSASLLQRRLKLGYNRAGRIVDQLEAAGIIGPFEGSKARQVLVPDEMALEEILNP
jgi:S-DNA-T family DNA segregation ATPase FtsK/SpoIIIE